MLCGCQNGSSLINLLVLCSVAMYGFFMGAIDVFDRYRQRFGLVKGHSFKKWYKKLGFSCVQDLELNAFFSWRMARGFTNAKDDPLRDAHLDFVGNMVHELLNTDWDVYDDESVLLCDDLGSLTLPSSPSANESPFFPRREPMEQQKCSPHSSVFDHNSSAKLCKVCWLELRPGTKQTQYCSNHKVSLCTKSYPSFQTPKSAI